MTKTYGNFTDFINFSRASSGTYLGSDGLLKTAADNVPRIEYDANGNEIGLLIEEQRTNLVTYSEDFTAWTAQPNSSVVSNDAVSPSGLMNADTITWAADNVSVYASVPVSTGDNTFSVWVRGVSGETISVWADAPAGTNDRRSLTLDGTWQRVSRTLSATSGGSAIVAVRKSGDTANSVSIWGAQLEKGSFATSYIPTSGATATRSADIASIATANFGYNKKAGTVVVEVDLPNLGNTGSGSEGIASFVANAAVENVGLYKKGFSTASQVRYEVRSSNASQATIDLTVPQQNSKMAYSFAADRFNLCVDGGLGTEDTSGNVPSGVTDLSLGNIYSVSGNNFLNGHIKSLKYIPRRNSNTQLQEFTS